MKTLIITLEYPPQVGGIATHVYEEAKYLGADKVVVLAPTMPGAGEFDAASNWPVARVKLFFGFLWPRWIKTLFLVWKAVRKYDIERIFVHHALPIGYVARFIFWRRKIPYYIFFHGTDVQMGFKKRRRLRYVTAKAKRVFANSEFVKRRLLELLGDEINVEIIYPCPGADFFDVPDEARIKILKTELGLLGKKVMLSVGRLADGKGYPHLARLMPKILERVPNLVWVVIGSGPKEGWFMRYVQKNELTGTIRFLGNQSHNLLPDFYQMADVFTLLTHSDTERDEAWGLVFLEAAASGVPVLAGRAGGVEETVVNNVTGLVVNVYNDDEVVDGIYKILTDPEFARQLADAAKKRASDQFRWEYQLKKLL